MIPNERLPYINAIITRNDGTQEIHPIQVVNGVATFGPGTDLDPLFRLAHGDSIHFENVPYGTTYVLTEHEKRHYDKTAAGYMAGEQWYYDDVIRNANLVVGGTAHQVVVGGEDRILRVARRLENNNEVTGNSATVTNYRTEDAPMGVFVDNAPFIGLILLAAASGLAGFRKMRKNGYEDA